MGHERVSRHSPASFGALLSFKPKMNAILGHNYDINFDMWCNENYDAQFTTIF
jgi:hypothetical protein